MTTFPPIHLLQTLAAFAEVRNVSKVGQVLQITQPTVTRHLQQLEEWSEKPLFKMIGRQKVLTEYGEALAKLLKEQLKEMERGLRRVQSQFTESIYLKVGARHEILEQYFVGLNFRGTLELIGIAGDKIEKDLKEQALDVAVHHHPVDSFEYISKEFFKSNSALVIPKKMISKAPSAKDFAKVAAQFPVAWYGSSQPVLREFVQKYEITGTLKPKLIATDWNSIEKNVDAGKCWTVMPTAFVRGGNYHVIDVQHSTTFFIIYRKELVGRSWFIEFLRTFLS